MASPISNKITPKIKFPVNIENIPEITKMIGIILRKNAQQIMSKITPISVIIYLYSRNRHHREQ